MSKLEIGVCNGFDDKVLATVNVVTSQYTDFLQLFVLVVSRSTVWCSYLLKKLLIA